MGDTRFVVLAAPRTGSNLLCTLLHSHPEIVCHHELFNPRGIFYALDRRDGSVDLGTVAERDRDPFAFLDRVWSAAAGARCVGFKMTTGQHPLVMRAMVDDPSVKKIVVHRTNRLATLVSQRVAERTDQWEVYDEDALVRDPPTISIDAAELRAHAEATDRFYEKIRRPMVTSRQHFVETRYEDLLDPAEHARLLAFLGVAARDRPLRAGSVKQRRRALRSVIANHDALEAALRGTDFHGELDDGGA